MTKYRLLFASLFLILSCEMEENPLYYTSDGWAYYGGLEWSPRSAEVMDWYDAVDYCENMGARLPTINELRKIIIDCYGSSYDGFCWVSDPDCLGDGCWLSEDCTCDGKAHNYSALNDGKETDLWSSSVHGKVDGDLHVWGVLFSSASLFAKTYYYDSFVRCVRPEK